MANGVQTLAGVNGWRIAGWGFAAALIVTPAVAMQFTSEVKWTLFDFAFAAVMIGGTGLLIELAVRTSRNLAYRAGAALALLTAFLLVWINAAVGIIGSEDNPANIVFPAIVALAAVGTLVARARPSGMAHAMFVTAAAQALTGAAVFAFGIGSMQPPGPVGLLVLIEGFAAMWLGSAMLFRRAAQA
jgi:hypothetical protein